MNKDYLIANYSDLLNLYTNAVMDRDNGGSATSHMVRYLNSHLVAAMYYLDDDTIERRTDTLERMIASQFPHLAVTP